MPRADMDRYIQQALQEAGQRGIHGKAVTPFLLTRIKELSGAEAWPPTSPWCSTTPWSAHASHGRSSNQVATLVEYAFGRRCPPMLPSRPSP